MGVARLVMIILSIVMFATMADSPRYSESHTFGYIVATGVFVFLWSLLTFFLPLYESLVAAFASPTLVQLIGDAFLVLMVFFAAVIGAAKCQNDYKVYCKYYKKPNASIVFAFFALLGQVACVFLGYRKLREERNGGSTYAPNAVTAPPATASTALQQHV